MWVDLRLHWPGKGLKLGPPKEDPEPGTGGQVFLWEVVPGRPNQSPSSEKPSNLEIRRELLLPPSSPVPSSLASEGHWGEGEHSKGCRWEQASPALAGAEGGRVLPGTWLWTGDSPLPCPRVHSACLSLTPEATGRV